MRIAFISYEFPPDTGKGGIGTYTKQVATLMANRGWDIHIFAGSHKRQVVEIQKNLHVHWVKCNNPQDFRVNVLPVFEKENGNKGFEVIESPEIHGNAWEIKQKNPQIPLVVRLHAPNHLVEHLKKTYIPFAVKLRYTAGAWRRFRLTGGYWRSYDKAADPDYEFIQCADQITAPSGAMKEWVVKHWKIPPQKVTVIPNIFIPSEFFLNIPIPEKVVHKRIVFFGRLNVLKGLVNASRAMKKILKEYPGWQFRLIGDDGPGPSPGISMRNWIKRELNEVMGSVEFMDGMDYDDLPAFIEETDIVLIPSLFESYSYTCAEAMSAGKAIVGSSIGGMSDLLKDGKYGILVNPYRVGEIYKALKKLIDNNQLRHKYAVEAREAIVHESRVEELAKIYEGFYEKAAGIPFL